MTIVDLGIRQGPGECPARQDPERDQARGGIGFTDEHGAAREAPVAADCGVLRSAMGARLEGLYPPRHTACVSTTRPWGTLVRSYANGGARCVSTTGPWGTSVRSYANGGARCVSTTRPWGTRGRPPRGRGGHRCGATRTGAHAACPPRGRGGHETVHHEAVGDTGLTRHAMSDVYPCQRASDNFAYGQLERDTEHR